MASSFREAAARGRQQKDYVYKDKKPQYNEDGSFKRSTDSEIEKAKARYANPDYYYQGPAWNPNTQDRVNGNKQALKDAIYSKYLKSQHPDYPAGPSSPASPASPSTPAVSSNAYWDAGADKIANVDNYGQSGLTDNEKIALGYAAGVPVAVALGRELSHRFPLGRQGGGYYAQNPLQLPAGAKVSPYTPVGGYTQLNEGVRSAAQARAAAAANGGPATAFKGTPVGGYQALGEGLKSQAAKVTPNYYQGARGVAADINQAASIPWSSAAMLGGPVAAAFGAGLYGADANEEALKKQIAEEDMYYNQNNDF